VAGSTVLATALAAQSPAAAAASRKAIANSKPAWIGHARNLGAAASTASVAGRVYLAPRGGLAAVAADAVARSTRGNASYRHFLSPSQYYAKFGTSADT